MGLDFAVSQLVETGWTGSNPCGCGRLADGRAYPEGERVAREFAEAGFVLRVRRIPLFDCYRAEWGEVGRFGESSPHEPCGAVVGHTRAEAAVYALSKMRRSLASVGA